MSERIVHSIFLLVFVMAFSFVRAQDTTVVFPPAVEQLPDTGFFDESDTGGGVSFGFNEKPARADVDIRTVPPAEVRARKLEDDYWYADKAPDKKNVQQQNANGKKGKRKPHDPVLFNAPWWRVLFWVLLVCFAGLLIWFLVTNNINVFRRSAKAQDENADDVQEENIFELDFEREIDRAVQQKNYRLAVRLLYLRTLRDLSNYNLINYTHEKTNSDYLMQLSGTSYYRNFFRLTRSFDYTWYGQFELSQENFETVRREFTSFKQQLR